MPDPYRVHRSFDQFIFGRQPKALSSSDRRGGAIRLVFCFSKENLLIRMECDLSHILRDEFSVSAQSVMTHDQAGKE